MGSVGGTGDASGEDAPYASLVETALSVYLQLDHTYLTERPLRMSKVYTRSTYVEMRFDRFVWLYAMNIYTHARARIHKKA